jgi:hypothetical protein
VNLGGCLDDGIRQSDPAASADDDRALRDGPVDLDDREAGKKAASSTSGAAPISTSIQETMLIADSW